MKIAIFHNFLDNIGGAEIVDLIMARELGADIYTTNIDREKIKRMGFGTANIFSIGKVPINAPFRQEVAYWRFRHLNLGRKYDFYIVSADWAVGATRHHHPNLWYVFSPIREIFDMREFTRENMVVKWKRPIFDFWAEWKKKSVISDAKRADKIISISKNVQNRVKKYLGRESKIIYPPIETKKYHYRKNGDFWLSVNRLINHKRVDMQIKAFAKMPEEKLIIVGSYEQQPCFRNYAAYIKKIKPDNVEIKSWVSQEELIELYADCRGFITASQDEDFGLTPLEAMASGKPVIAPNEGGYKETIINGANGRLIDDISEDKIIEAVREINKNPVSYREACQKQTKKFDLAIFIDKVKQEIKELHSHDRKNNHIDSQL